MAYQQIGQYRFQGKSNECATPVDSQLKYCNGFREKVYEEDDVSSFQDVLIVPQLSEGFLANKGDYYVKVKVPQDMNYDMSFNIKLVQTDGSSLKDGYQFLKYFHLPKAMSGRNVYMVVLYEDLDGKVQVAIPADYDPSLSSSFGQIYYDVDNEQYFLGIEDGAYKPTYNINDLYVAASWKEETGDFFGVFEIIFRPLENFDAILLEMVRSAEDYNIFRTSADGVSSEFGRKIDISQTEVEMYELTNLAMEMYPEISIVNKKSLKKIGVWGHPGLAMAVNGEEIRIGQSGYYELDAIPIYSLGVVAIGNDFSQNFTIDYSYEVFDVDENEI